MLKAQLVEAFQRIYHVLPATLQHSFWTVMILTVVVALTEFALAGAVSLLGVVLASPQSIVQHPFTGCPYCARHWMTPACCWPCFSACCVVLPCSRL